MLPGPTYPAAFNSFLTVMLLLTGTYSVALELILKRSAVISRARTYFKSTGNTFSVTATFKSLIYSLCFAS